MNITWHMPADLDQCMERAPQKGSWCRVLCADLRDARILPLTRPAPLTSDYMDEARPATNDRAYFLARRAVSRSLLGAIAGVAGDAVQVRYDEDGAPRVITPDGLYISLSGHGPYALIAIANCPVGVDFEAALDEVDPVPDVLHEQEQRSLAGLSAAEKSTHFLRIWTAKEAYLKAMGRGFLDDPAKVRIRFADQTIEIENNGKAQQKVAGALRDIVLDGTAIIAACVMADMPG